MKRNRSLIIGVICGLCCMICVAFYVMSVDERVETANAEALERYGGDQIEVCVATRDIAAGEVLDESCLETKTWVATLIPEDAITTTADAVGKQVGSSILKGEVISSKRFGTSIASLEIPEGLAAISVPARDVQAVGGALAAGMKADVYAIGSSSTVKLVSQALIVATSVSESGSSSSSNSWITLAVPPSVVEELVSAAENLELYFVLPAGEDSSDQSITENSTGENKITLGNTDSSSAGTAGSSSGSNGNNSSSSSGGSGSSESSGSNSNSSESNGGNGSGSGSVNSSGNVDSSDNSSGESGDSRGSSGDSDGSGESDGSDGSNDDRS